MCSKPASAPAAEAIAAAVNRPAARAGAADARLADLVQGTILSQCALQRAQLPVGVQRLLDLSLGQVRPRTAEAIALNQESADVPQLEVPQLAQEAHAPTHLAALPG